MIILCKLIKMNQEKLKLIVKNLESLVNCLKSELEFDEKSNLNYEQITPYLEDYDEVFYEDEDAYAN